jgi:glycosyltransferase involved in cell wall biosynthesis
MFGVKMFVSIVMPCLNEHETLGICIHKARKALEQLGIDGEIIVADNGSTDGSVEIARALGAHVVEESKKGYGNAYRAGIAAASGEYIIIGDSDDSYDFADVGRFIDTLKQGFDLVMGTRLRGTINKGAMPWMNRYIGNPALTGILNIFFRSGISDAHCGMRGFTKAAYLKMDLQTAGMEFASEMVIKAALIGLKMTEIPITLHLDGRSSAPHLRPFRDGWRHLRFMLLHSPTHLYIWPGFAMFTSGMIAMLLLLISPERIFGRMVDLHIMILGSLFTILGYQTILLGLYARIYAVTHNFIPQGKFLRQMFQVFNLERGLAVGAVILIIGIAMGIFLLVHWLNKDFEQANQVRLALFASTLIIIGSQTIFSSFFMSMLGIERK